MDAPVTEALLGNERACAFLEERIQKGERARWRFSKPSAPFAAAPEAFREGDGELVPGLKKRRWVIPNQHKDLAKGLYPPDS